jgi:hypothetical protein
MKRKDSRFAEEKKLATPLSRRKTATQASQSRRFPETFVASIGTVPPAPWPDSPALQTAPLHCRDPQTTAERYRFVPTAANSRDRPQIGRTQRNQQDVARLRPT